MKPEPLPTPTPVVDGILVEFRTNARVYVEAAVDGNQVLAETLSLPLDAIRVSAVDTEAVPYDYGAQGSRTIGILASCG